MTEYLLFPDEKAYRQKIGLLASISPTALLCDAATLRKNCLRVSVDNYRTGPRARYAIKLTDALAQLKARREHLTERRRHA